MPPPSVGCAAALGLRSSVCVRARFTYLNIGAGGGERASGRGRVSVRALSPYGFTAQEHTHPMTQREFQKEMVRAMTSQWNRL